MLRADSPLFKPVQIGNVLLPNRFMRSATWEGGSDDSGAPQPPLLSMISKLAREEVGLVVPGFVYPLRAGQAMPNQTGVNSAALRRVAADDRRDPPDDLLEDRVPDRLRRAR